MGSSSEAKSEPPKTTLLGRMLSWGKGESETNSGSTAAPAGEESVDNTPSPDPVSSMPPPDPVPTMPVSESSPEPSKLSPEDPSPESSTTIPQGLPPSISAAMRKTELDKIESDRLAAEAEAAAEARAKADAEAEAKRKADQIARARATAQKPTPTAIYSDVMDDFSAFCSSVVSSGKSAVRDSLDAVAKAREDEVRRVELVGMLGECEERQLEAAEREEFERAHELSVEMGKLQEEIDRLKPREDKDGLEDHRCRLIQDSKDALSDVDKTLNSVANELRDFVATDKTPVSESWKQTRAVTRKPQLLDKLLFWEQQITTLIYPESWLKLTLTNPPLLPGPNRRRSWRIKPRSLTMS